MERYNEHIFHKKVVLINFAIFTENPCAGVSFFLNKNAGLLSWNLIKKCLKHRYFRVNIVKILRTPVLKNICERLFKGFVTGPNNKTSNRKWRKNFLKTNNITNNMMWRKTFLSASWKELAFTWRSWSFRFSLLLQCMSQAVFALQNKRW